MAIYGEFRSLLPLHIWTDLLRHGSPRDFAPGITLISQGESRGEVMLLTAGQVKVTRLEVDGTEMILAVCLEGALLGEMATLLDGMRSATVTAVTRCTAHVLPAPVFWDRIREHDLGQVMLRHTAALLDEGNRIRTEVGMVVRQRISRLLVRLMDRIGTPHGSAILLQLALTHEDLARAIGSSRAMLAVELARLRSEGIIQTSRRRIVIADPARLRAIATGSPADC
jgi:CRP-like cAMP-binding protein